MLTETVRIENGLDICVLSTLADRDNVKRNGIYEVDSEVINLDHLILIMNQFESLDSYY